MEFSDLRVLFEPPTLAPTPTPASALAPSHPPAPAPAPPSSSSSIVAVFLSQETTVTALTD